MGTGFVEVDSTQFGAVIHQLIKGDFRNKGGANFSSHHVNEHIQTGGGKGFVLFVGSELAGGQCVIFKAVVVY